MPGRAGSVLAGMQHEAALPRGRRDPSRSAPPPFVVELVAGDPPVIGPVVIEAWRVPPTAVIGAVVGLPVVAGAVLPDPVAVARPVVGLPVPRVIVAPVPLALFPGGEFIAGDPPVIGPVVIEAWAVPPTAVVGAVVGLVIELGAVFPDPVAVAAPIGLVDAPVPLAFLPGGELVAGNPEVIGPVVVHLWGVPPTAVIRAVVGLVVHAGAIFPDPVTPAVVAELVSGAGSDSGGSKESSKCEFHRFFVFIITNFRELIKGSI